MVVLISKHLCNASFPSQLQLVHFLWVAVPSSSICISHKSATERITAAGAQAFQLCMLRSDRSAKSA